LEDPIFLYKIKQNQNILLETILLTFILCFVAFLIFKGIFEKNWVSIVFGIIPITLVYFSSIQYRKISEWYVAVYPNKIIEKKKVTKEVKLNDVIEVKYFKKERYVAKTLWYYDYLQFNFKNQEEPILIQPSFRGTVAPYNKREETIEILNYLRFNYPKIKLTKDK
jgi:hypothetical protein